MDSRIRWSEIQENVGLDSDPGPGLISCSSSDTHSRDSLRPRGCVPECAGLSLGVYGADPPLQDPVGPDKHGSGKWEAREGGVQAQIISLT